MLKKLLLFFETIGIFILSWIVLSLLFYSLTELSFLIKVHTEFGRSFVTYYTQILAFIMAIIFAAVYKSKNNKAGENH